MALSHRIPSRGETPTRFVSGQIGLPPRRIDVLNRADGITFHEAIAEGARKDGNSEDGACGGLKADSTSIQCASGARRARKVWR